MAMNSRARMRMQLSQRREWLALKPPALQLRRLVRLADLAWSAITIVACSAHPPHYRL
jgi:hypothetical protein